MKRGDLLRHLVSWDCYRHRQGGKHEIWRNPKNGQQTTVPRHPEISKYLAKKICKQLDIPAP